LILDRRQRKHRLPRSDLRPVGSGEQLGGGGQECRNPADHGLGLPGLIRDQMDQQIVSKISSLKRSARRAADRRRFGVPVGADQPVLRLDHASDALRHIRALATLDIDGKQAVLAGAGRSVKILEARLDRQ
jgi:hypothetical protein